MSHSMLPDDASARACALNLLVNLRSLQYSFKEELFATAVIFYRWYFAHYDEMEHLNNYLDLFHQLHPTLLVEQTEAQYEASFVAWFVDQGFHQMPVIKRFENHDD